MISYKGRESKRGKVLKMTRNLERLYKEGKCRDCAVVVTRMDFAKILGKFTKVKIQYESSTSPKTQKTSEVPSPNSNTRLKKNENGMVLIRRNAYNEHPVKDKINNKRQKAIDVSTPPAKHKKINTSATLVKQKHVEVAASIQTPVPRKVNNILKENNGLRNSAIKDKNSNYSSSKLITRKQYAIIFNKPSCNKICDVKCDSMSLMELLPKIDNGILPSDEWCIEYYPKSNEPKDDKVYDRIAAELEDLMYNEKPVTVKNNEKQENKVEDFPSIMDILNDTTPEDNSASKDQSNNVEFKDSLESNDVEAMLLGKVNDDKTLQETPMEVDNADVKKLIEDVVQLASSTDEVKNNEPNDFENPHSPSILDEALQKGIEEHIVPNNQLEKHDESKNITNIEHKSEIENKIETNENKINEKDNSPSKTVMNNNTNPNFNVEDVTHVTFRKMNNGKCCKSVTCPKNLKYSIELEEKAVEFLGAPKHISSLEDLQVLLQIVNETDLRSLYVLH